MKTCDSQTAEHLRAAGDHLHQAARAWADHVIDPTVRGHLRQAARSALQAGLAALDASERRSQPAATPPPAQPT